MAVIEPAESTQHMARAFLFVLDSFGIGGAPDAASFGDEGSDTFGHIEAACARGEGDAAGLRENPDVKEFYLGLAGESRKSFRDVKHYRRRKRWL